MKCGKGIQNGTPNIEIFPKHDLLRHRKIWNFSSGIAYRTIEVFQIP